jgi:hypothetical protein
MAMKTIGFRKGRFSAQKVLLELLAEAFNVRFQEVQHFSRTGIDAWLISESDWEENPGLFDDRPCYAVFASQEGAGLEKAQRCRFSSDVLLPGVLRGREIALYETVASGELPEWLDACPVVARIEGMPFWRAQQTACGYRHFVSLSLPSLEADEPLFAAFSGKRFIQLLPFIVFLLDLVQEDQQWEHPPLQACFMFDDPNLHWRTYGFIDYKRLVHEAETNNFHVSMATIPLDHWFIHRPTAAIFREHTRRLSLLIHGNNHLSRELAQTSVSESYAMLKQALSRTAKLESRSGISVSRVMAPPHGACHASIMPALAQVGFEALCVSRWSLFKYNKGESWAKTVGMLSGQRISGLPILPRFPFSPYCHNGALVAAILRQPMIIVGHHEEVRDGFGSLNRLAEFINSMGHVQWANMTQIARTRYYRRIEGSVLRLHMLTNHVELDIPEGVSALRLDMPAEQAGGAAGLLVKTPSKAGELWEEIDEHEGLAVTPGDHIEIRVPQSVSPEYRNGGSAGIRPWALFRRQCTEFRDRLMPFVAEAKKAKR